MGFQSRSPLQASKGLKLGLHGHYSIERLCALHEYTKTKSYLHVTIVCVLMSMPPLLSVVILEMMPLHDPSAGWNNNTVFWIRSFVGIFIISVGVVFQLQAMAPAASLNLRQCLLLSIVAASSYVASLLLIAEYVAFPVPFTLVAGVPAWALCLFPGMALAIGVARLKHDTTLRAQFLRFGNKIMLESNFMVIYPVYSLVFLSLSGASQFFFMFVLQIIKLILKKSMVKLIPDMEDLVPVVVISVDLFNALYQSKCMQSAGSLLATSGIIAVDAVQNLFVLRGLFRNMEEVMVAGQLSVSSKGLLAHVLALVDDPDTIAVDALLGVRVAASPSLRLPDQQKKLIDRLHTAQQIHLDSEISPPAMISFKPATVPIAPARATSMASASVSPAPVTESVKLDPTAPMFPVKADISCAEKTLFIKKTLQLLFKCELVLLVEYIESAISLLYAIYLLILYHLPNAKYYSEMAEVTPSELQSAVLGIVVYAFLEALSLIAVHCVLRWKFNMSALHQMAFVFQTDWLVIQSAFMAWVIMILQFTLEHNGVDFSFRFKWVHNATDTSV
uniref:Uncharacterized protein n=1 Tax=Globisporangium ultimum (strain ATCC 200006 / CBS 805.95 / DAOM BR144) TaxID=431595 RepID=K3WJK9_GLOUD